MSRPLRAFDFDSAIARKPGTSVVKGLRAGGQEDPDFEAVSAEHDAYVAALRHAGVEVQVLEPLEAFPDSVFVEDPALVFHEGAILLRPGVGSREGETAAIAPVLRDRFDRVLELGAGYVDGGDVLTTSDRVMIGLSARTDREGAEALISSLAKLGRKGEIVHTPSSVLHFKSDCSLMDDTTILSTQRLAESGVFSGFETLIVPEGEEGAANALRINDTIFLAEGFPGTLALLEGAGYHLATLKTSEIAKIDAGLSCMSLRWLS
ncbi:dimethylarginine dimethylaminohydrolase family protein [Denitrobaculum tricleocarpae]|uniref:Dimethylarginine dimethylaminohydrolase n=1 Tax=Denitrobaculum tricleocarpae TaxID=2591009 RepID=A0A545TQ18_9PROT|nr:arginine deiminase family protein [Denitrobaculum tricleocarpae]TQV79316.1 dimethylarginine dimethylaminohydrolase [Denitrobaculum tricleocarpae]